MTAQRYLQAVRAVLDHLERSQLSAVARAADHVVSALRNSGAVFCAEIGHGIQHDFINRAGGLAAVQAFSWRMEMQERTARCQQRSNPDRDIQTARFAVHTSTLRAGDVLVLGSVSGKNRVPVELALVCREKGVRTIGLTSFEYSRQVTSLHPSGKKLMEVVDVAIDIGAPYGDAAVEVTGYPHKLLPVSGVAMITAGHMIWGTVAEKMAQCGQPVATFLSINREGGPEAYRQAVAEFEQRGY
ncbi:MAG: sugar isomerase domain-containing protein [Verrucomicrobiae bacterium]|nr:sugar isomerase domain-containing protein [Verrucomicrobiae bacterium]